MPPIPIPGMPIAPGMAPAIMAYCACVHAGGQAGFPCLGGENVTHRSCRCRPSHEGARLHHARRSCAALTALLLGSLLGLVALH